MQFLCPTMGDRYTKSAMKSPLDIRDVIFPSIPEDLISRPTLVWLLKNDRSTAQKVEVLYLTNGINWRVDYLLT